MKQINPRSGWFSAPGPEQDIVVSSRIRLARGCAGYVYPRFLSMGEADVFRERAAEAMDRVFPSASRLDLDELSEDERRVLMERNLVPTDLEASDGADLYVGADERLSVLVNVGDHFRLVGLAPGLALSELYREVSDLAGQVDELVPFAASLEFGYLTSELENLGTGLRASTMLHLPALQETGLLPAALKMVSSQEVVVKAFSKDVESSQGGMYQLANRRAIGVAEQEVLEKLEDATRQLVHYERDAREVLVQSQASETRDAVSGAIGVLRESESISGEEAFALLSRLRLGAALGMTEGMKIAEVTSRFFLCQKANLHYWHGNADHDEQRAKLLQELLSSGC